MCGAPFQTGDTWRCVQGPGPWIPPRQPWHNPTTAAPLAHDHIRPSPVTHDHTITDYSNIRHFHRPKKTQRPHPSLSPSVLGNTSGGPQQRRGGDHESQRPSNNSAVDAGQGLASAWVFGSTTSIRLRASLTCLDRPQVWLPSLGPPRRADRQHPRPSRPRRPGPRLPDMPLLVPARHRRPPLGRPRAGQRARPQHHHPVPVPQLLRPLPRPPPALVSHTPQALVLRHRPRGAAGHRPLRPAPRLHRGLPAARQEPRPQRRPVGQRPKRAGLQLQTPRRTPSRQPGP